MGKFKILIPFLSERIGNIKEMFKTGDGEQTVENKDPFAELVHKFVIEQKMSTCVLVNGGTLIIDDCILSLK